MEPKRRKEIAREFNFLENCADSADLKIKKKFAKSARFIKKTLKNFSVFYIFSTDCFVILFLAMKV
jgi:hypothetical protein